MPELTAWQEELIERDVRAAEDAYLDERIAAIEAEGLGS